MTPNADHDLSPLEARIIAAAPRPNPTFEKTLGDQLMNDFIQHHNAPTKSAPSRLRSRRLWGIIAAVLVMIGAGVVVALNTLMPQLLQGDPGLFELYQQGGGQHIGVSQTHDDLTVTVDWAYADGNRLAIAAIITGQPDQAYYQFMPWEYTLTRRDTGAELPLFMGMAGLLDENGDLYYKDQETLLSAQDGILFYTFDAGDVLDDLAAQGNPTLDLALTLGVSTVTAFDYDADMPRDALFAQMHANQTRHETPFTFDFSVALDNRQRVLISDQTATDQDIAITLKRVVVSPSQTRVTVCFPVPDAARHWTAIPHLSNDTGEIIGGAVQPSLDGAQSCQEYPYQTAMLDYDGAWQLRISELVGFGSSGADQTRIAGDWRFTFTVPPLQ